MAEKSTENTYDLKAARGQAFNLAVHTAIAQGRQNDAKYIYSEFLRYFEMGQLIQKCSLDEIREALVD